MKKKTCRIYKDRLGKWIMGWYIGMDWHSIQRKEKEQLIRYAKRNGFDSYKDQSKEIDLQGE